MIRNRMQKKLILPTIQLMTGERFLQYAKEMNEIQYWSKDQLEEFQWEKINHIITHAYKTVPFYKQKFDQYGIKVKDIQNFEDFKKIPFLKKEEVRDNYSDMVSSKASKRITLTHSSGTMGKPINIYRDPFSFSIDRAVKMRCLKWYNVDYGAKEARIWGLSTNRLTFEKQRIQDILLNRIRMAPFNLTLKEVDSFNKKISHFKPEVLYGWLSGVFKFSQIANENNLDITHNFLKVIVVTAEPLNSFQREIIENTFQKKVANEYGCSETGVIAFNCPEGYMHLMSDSVYVEFEKNDKTGVSEILLTDIKNLSMPLIRYQIGDVGSLYHSSKLCKCGITFPRMEIINGRGLDLLKTLNGRYVHGGLLAYIGFDLIQKYDSIKDFRIIQDENYNIIVRYVKEKNFQNVILSEFKKRIKKHLGEKINVEFIQEDEIPLESSGKQRFVISKLVTKETLYH